MLSGNSSCSLGLVVAGLVQNRGHSPLLAFEVATTPGQAFCSPGFSRTSSAFLGRKVSLHRSRRRREHWDQNGNKAYTPDMQAGNNLVVTEVKPSQLVVYI